MTATMTADTPQAVHDVLGTVVGSGHCFFSLAVAALAAFWTVEVDSFHNSSRSVEPVDDQAGSPGPSWAVMYSRSPRSLAAFSHCSNVCGARAAAGAGAGAGAGDGGVGAC